MAQRHFRFEGRATPIVLDDCEAHGIWFDAEESEAALQVVRDHARAIARHRSEGLDRKPPQNPKPNLSPAGASAVAAQARNDRKINAASETAAFFADVGLSTLFAVIFD